MSTSPDRTERLWPAVSTWLAVTVMAAFSAVVALPFGGTAGAVTFAAAMVVMGGLLLSAAPLVGVRSGEFVARRAHVPVQLIGDVTVLDAERMRVARGPGLDARAFLCLSGWVRTGLRLDLVDPQDPTPYWLVSCRRPQRLLDAVEEARRTG